jgi:hypothetical protein
VQGAEQQQRVTTLTCTEDHKHTQSASRANLFEVVIVALVVVELLVLKVDDVSHDGTQEVLVVRYDKQCVFPLLEVVLKPDHGV